MYHKIRFVYLPSENIPDMTGTSYIFRLFDCLIVSNADILFQYSIVPAAISTHDHLKNINRVFPRFAYGIPFLIQGVSSKI
ncbi:MAG TPA: hypothetical protein DCX89_09495 [Saprospirales bacterium]|nr:hypothetical protein [Saprospirales bacterium]